MVKKNKNVSNVNNNMLDLHYSNIDNYNTRCDLVHIEKKISLLNNRTIKTHEVKKCISNLRQDLFEERKKKSSRNNYIYNTTDILENYYNLELCRKRESEKVDINFFFSNKKNPNASITKKKLLNEYIFMNDNVSQHDIDEENAALRICSLCDTYMIISKNNDFFVCISCGALEPLMINIDSCCGSQNETYSKSSIYQRKNHFKEWLNKIQAKERIEISTETLDKINAEIRNLNITDLTTLNIDTIRKILKKLKLTKYYEHAFHIIYILNGKSPISLTPNIEKDLIRYFKQIEEPFRKFKKRTRKNILRYSYILHKLCELLELDDILNNFILVKNRNKLVEQDAIWKSICKELRWEFIPSI
jgi:hypothetical protein